VVSNDPLTERIKGIFLGATGNSGGTTAGIELSSQVSIGSTGTFSYDLQEFVRDNLSYDIRQPSTAANAYVADNSIFRVASQTYIELLDDDGVLVNGATTVGTQIIFFINAIRQVDQVADIGDYIMNSSVSGVNKFLTNSPRTIFISQSESYVLSVYSQSSNINEITVAFRDASGAILSLQTIPYNTNLTGRYDIAVGLANLATAGITPPANAYDYVIWVSNSGTVQSEPFIFRIDRNCYEDPLRVHFLNKLGGIDSYTFKGLNKLETTTTSSQYEKNLGINYNQQTRGRQTQYRQILTAYVATSEILSSAESIWLEELVTSPVLYLELGNLLFPVTINDGKFLIEDRFKLKQLQLTLTFANDLRNQRL
jgi:hypothetical protein